MTAHQNDPTMDDLEGPSDARDLLLLCSEYGHIAGVLSQASDRQGAQAARQIGKVCAILARDEDDPDARALEAKRVRMLIRLSYQMVELDKAMEREADERPVHPSRRS